MALFFALFVNGAKIAKISIKGNIFFTEKQIKKVLNSKEKKEFNKLQFKEDKHILLNLYRSVGYLQTKIKEYRYESIDNRVNIFIDIDEGYQTIINKVKVFGNKVVPVENILNILNIEKNMPYSEVYLSIKQLDLKNYYALKGYIYANIQFELFDRENQYRKILYVNIDENKRVYIRDISFDSIPDNTRKVAEYVVKWKKGDVYSPEKIFNYQQDLYTTGLFSYIAFKSKNIDKRSDSIDIVFYGKEKKKYYIGGGLLYQFPDRGKISLIWGNDNVFNNGEKFSISSYYLLNLETDYWFNSDITFIVPYAFNNLFSYNFRVLYEQEKNDFYKLMSLSLLTGFSKKVFNHILTNNYKYKMSVFDTNGLNVSLSFLNPSTNSSSFKIYYNNKDNIFYPTRGFSYSLQLEYAGGILKGYNNFYKYMFEFTGFKTLKKRITNAFRIGMGYMIPFASSVNKGISIDEQFVLGGYSSVRGAENDSLGPLNQIGTHSGTFFVNTNIESRIIIYKILGMSYFIDSGVLNNSINTIDMRSIAICGGFGIFANTIIGPVRFDIARPFSMSGNLQYYINLGNSF